MVFDSMAMAVCPWFRKTVVRANSYARVESPAWIGHDNQDWLERWLCCVKPLVFLLKWHSFCSCLSVVAVLLYDGTWTDAVSVCAMSGDLVVGFVCRLGFQTPWDIVVCNSARQVWIKMLWLEMFIVLYVDLLLLWEAENFRSYNSNSSVICVFGVF